MRTDDGPLPFEFASSFLIWWSSAPCLWFLTVVTFVPLAATLYLTTTTVWTIVERALLRRRYWRGEEGTAAVPARA